MIESIKALRENHNYSQSYLANFLGISRQMYIKYESGEVEPPVRIIVSLAKLYSVSYAQIIDNELNPNKEKVFYKINQDTDSEIASPSVNYDSATKNNNYAFLISLLKTMPEDSITSVLTFAKMLQSEQIVAKKTSPKSKKAFFDLAGKINLDSESVTEFREASLI